MRLMADEDPDLTVVNRLREAGLPVVKKAAILIDLLGAHGTELPGAFAVVSPGLLRIRREPVD